MRLWWLPQIVLGRSPSDAHANVRPEQCSPVIVSGYSLHLKGYRNIYASQITMYYVLPVEVLEALGNFRELSLTISTSTAKSR